MIPKKSLSRPVSISFISSEVNLHGKRIAVLCFFISYSFGRFKINTQLWVIVQEIINTMGCKYRNQFSPTDNHHLMTLILQETSSIKRVITLSEPIKMPKRQNPPSSIQLGGFFIYILWGFAECGNRKALGLKAQGVYLCK